MGGLKSKLASAAVAASSVFAVSSFEAADAALIADYSFGGVTSTLRSVSGSSQLDLETVPNSQTATLIIFNNVLTQTSSITVGTTQYEASVAEVRLTNGGANDLLQITFKNFFQTVAGNTPAVSELSFLYAASGSLFNSGFNIQTAFEGLEGGSFSIVNPSRARIDGRNFDVNQHTYSLNVIPEPAVAVLGLLGGAGLLLRRRRDEAAPTLDSDSAAPAPTPAAPL